ncbi:Protein kinase domain-containing protein [Aphelenchoides besseyi]|nr:Protein kinase domain-containing protein [Aphelenchoides besseyi]
MIPPFEKQFVCIHASTCTPYIFDKDFQLALKFDICSWKFPTKKPKQTLSDGAKVGISIAGALCLVLLLGVIIFLGLRVRRRYHESKMEWFAEQHTLNARSLLFGRTRKVDEWEVTPLNLRIETDHTIGSGISAAVYKGYLKRDGEVERIVVAAKFAHTYSSLMSKKAMMKEIELMKTLKLHPNIVKFYGCVSKIEQPAIITEFCSNGDLLKHIRAQELLVRDLLRISSEVCSAMVHLSSLGLVHRDLAARNVFLTDDMTAKVGDFGLCHRMNVPLTAEEKREKLPVTHMPFELLKFGDFSEKSDVWSFGCLLFEMFSGDRRPFSDVEPSDLIEYLEEDRKPEFPEDTPLEMVQLAHSKCFVKDKEERATFEDLQRLLDQIKFS